MEEKEEEDKKPVVLEEFGHVLEALGVCLSGSNKTQDVSFLLPRLVEERDIISDILSYCEKRSLTDINLGESSLFISSDNQEASLSVTKIASIGVKNLFRLSIVIF